jgi:hypothetical protein
MLKDIYDKPHKTSYCGLMLYVSIYGQMSI